MPSKESDGLLEEEESASAAAHLTHSPSKTLALTLVSAGLGNSLSAISTNFADIIKVRQQLQENRTRVGFWTVGKAMAKTEGFKSFFNGVTATCLRESTYSSIRMGTYETFRDLYSNVIPASSFGNKLLSGMTSGAIGAAVSTPTDLMKVRMQAARPTGRPPYPNTFIGFARVFQEGRTRAEGSGIVGGVRSLWRGTAPNVVRAAILTASQLGCYDEAKGQFKRRLGMQEGLQLHFASSFVAGKSLSRRTVYYHSLTSFSRLCMCRLQSACGRHQGPHHDRQVASIDRIIAFSRKSATKRRSTCAVQGLRCVLAPTRAPQCHLAYTVRAI